MSIISKKLLLWYDEHHRILPWRISPSKTGHTITPNPYHIWLSEIMLQQTTVEAVKKYYLKFIKKWPDIFALANASEDEILQNWAGLGYYARARNLRACAQQIVLQYQGNFPKDFKTLKQLRGIGDYTASAICAIAFQQNIAVVDSNIERIIARLFAIENILPKAKKDITEKMQKLMPEKRPGDFAQAMMDLGAGICSVKNPLCTQCPLNQNCLAHLMHKEMDFPKKPPAKVRPKKYGQAFFLASQENTIYLEKRPQTGLLARMTQIPNFFSENPLQKEPDFHQLKIFEKHIPENWTYCGNIEHIFTHFSLILDIYKIENLTEDLYPTDGKTQWWAPKNSLYLEALPTLMKKALQKAMYNEN